MRQSAPKVPMSICPDYHEFISELAIELVNAPLREHSGTIRAALERIGCFLEADRVYVFDYDLEAGIATSTHEWCREPIASQPEGRRRTPLDGLRADWLAPHLRGEPVCIPAVDALPEGRLRQLLGDRGTRSLLALPLLDGAACLGFVGIDHVRRHHAFDAGEGRVLRLFARLLVNLELRRRAEAELRTLWRAVEQSPNGIILTDELSKIVYANPRYLEMSGYAADEVLGRDPGTMGGGHAPPVRFEDMRRRLAAGESWKGELANRRRDGTEVTEFVSISPVRRADGVITHYFGVHEDITERKRVAHELDAYRNRLEALVSSRTAELERAKAAAEAASRAKSEFLANMSHEIRTPLNGVIGMSFLLRRELAEPRQQERVERIAGAARHLLGLIDDVLDLAEIEARRLRIAPAPFRLAALVDHVHSLTAERAQARGLAFESDIEPGLREPVFLGDFLRIAQVLLNFVGNAIKFTARGHVRLSARRVRETAGGVEVRFEVEDSGIGIAGDALQRIFEPFEQAESSTTRRFGGTGLGLPISRQLARLMGGEVGVLSRVGVGSTFWFQLVLGRGGVGAEPARDRPAAILRSGARVLLAEDNETNREVAAALLRDAELEVDTARDGVEAVERAAAGDHDLVLMDMRMPRLDGCGAARRIRALPRTRHLPIVALTANDSAEDRLACFDAGMDDFVAKPAEPATLYAVLARWIPARPAVARPADAVALDADAGLRNVGGDPAVYHRLLGRFAALHLEDAGRVRAALSVDDGAAARLVAHSLKGAAATIGAESVREAAARVERTLAATGRVDDEALRILAEGLDVLGGVIATIAVEDVPAAAAASGATPPALARGLEDLATLLADNDYRACAAWREIAEPLGRLVGAGPADELARLVADFDFETALARLRELPPFDA